MKPKERKRLEECIYDLDGIHKILRDHHEEHSWIPELLIKIKSIRTRIRVLVSPRAFNRKNSLLVNRENYIH